MPAPRETPDAYLALADQTRRRILELLSKSELTVNELTDRLPVRQPTVSEHLAVLRSVGLVTAEKDGRQRIYRLRQETIAQVQAWLTQITATPAVPHKPTQPTRKPAPSKPPQKDDWAAWA